MSYLSERAHLFLKKYMQLTGNSYSASVNVYNNCKEFADYMPHLAAREEAKKYILSLTE